MNSIQYKAERQSIKDFKRAFARLMKVGYGASKAYEIAMKSAGDVGYSM